MQNTSKELLACPFCGEKEHISLKENTLGHFVSCICGSGTYYEEREPNKAVEAWNTRVGDTATMWLSQVQLRNRQLTATQQRLDVAVEALEKIRTYNLEFNTRDYIQNIAKAALNTIRGKD